MRTGLTISRFSQGFRCSQLFKTHPVLHQLRFYTVRNYKSIAIFSRLSEAFCCSQLFKRHRVLRKLRFDALRNYKSIAKSIEMTECGRKVIDLRSDTVTKPTAKMREAMANAVVGDDVFGEDPTVNELEARCAEYFGKEAAVFIPTGTMGNLLAVMAHCPKRGSEMIVGQFSHIHRWEQGNYAHIAGVCATTIPNSPDGSLDLDLIEKAVRVEWPDTHYPKTELICLELSYNYGGGVTFGADYIKKVRVLANKHDFKIHVDGARIVNAAVQLGTTVKELVKDADSVQMCFSKGLGAPIGSILVGSKKFIKSARKFRKAIGGSMRQAGVIAAPALLALEEAEHVVKRDHANATRLAKGIHSYGNKSTVSIDLTAQQTNFVMVNLHGISGEEMCKRLEAQTPAVLTDAIDANRLRLVTHRDLEDGDIDLVINAFK